MKFQNQTLRSQVVEFLEAALEENAEIRDINSLLMSKPIMLIDYPCIQSIYTLHFLLSFCRFERVPISRVDER